MKKVGLVGGIGLNLQSPTITILYMAYRSGLGVTSSPICQLRVLIYLSG